MEGVLACAVGGFGRLVGAGFMKYTGGEGLYGFWLVGG